MIYNGRKENPHRAETGRDKNDNGRAGDARLHGAAAAGGLYRRGPTEIDEMSNLSLKNRELLKHNCQVGRYDPAMVQTSVDGTRKYLFRTAAGTPWKRCTSRTATATRCACRRRRAARCTAPSATRAGEGFHGQPSAADILNQIMSVPEAELLTNLVFMGMGEPMDNLPEVMRALDVLTADYGYAWSPRRITVSTIGLLPGLRTFLEQSACHLAVSMHSPFHQERLELMPVERAYPLAEVLSLVRRYDFSHQRRVSFEYILFEGYNDTPRHAIETVRLLRGWNAGSTSSASTPSRA